VTAVLYFLWISAILWTLRRFGFVAVLGWGIGNHLILISPGGTSASWYAGYNLVTDGLLIGIAAWALWVILSVQRRPGAESAG